MALLPSPLTTQCTCGLPSRTSPVPDISSGCLYSVMMSLWASLAGMLLSAVFNGSDERRDRSVLDPSLRDGVADGLDDFLAGLDGDDEHADSLVLQRRFAMSGLLSLVVAAVCLGLAFSSVVGPGEAECLWDNGCG
jgi:hypothetical protein